MREDIIAGLDIGTFSIKVLVLKKNQKWEVVSYNEVPSFGVRKGAVMNVEETTKRIKMAIKEAEKEQRSKIESVFVNIGGNHLYVIPSDGIISVSRADQRISKEDVERVLQATKAVNIPRNDEVIDVIPREYIIDDQKGIKEPVNLAGVRLEARVLLLCGFSPFFVNLTKAVLNADLKINDVIPSPLAAARAVLAPQQKELGVAVIDLGAATTSLVVFEEGELVHLAIFPIGGANITNDIAIGLRTDVEIAEMIKKQYGACLLSKAEKLTQGKKIEVFDRSSLLVFSKKELVNIIQPRVIEILNLIQKELKKINKHQLPGGVILTGGGAKLNKIKEFTRESLRLSCEIGVPRDIEGIQEDPSWATVAGLAMEGIDFNEEESILKVAKKWREKIKKFFRLFLP